MRIAQAVELLDQMTDDIHHLATGYPPEAGRLLTRSHGACDLMTKLALERLPDKGFEVLVFVGVSIPRRTIQDITTHPSHTVGVLHRFAHPDERDHCLLFDFACAQYGFELPLMTQVISKEDLYHRLRQTYGGGIWQPGGSWLKQIDTHAYLDALSAPPAN